MLNNRELQLALSNLLATEEHLVEMMVLSEKEKDIPPLVDKLKEVKSTRNELIHSSILGLKEKERDLLFNKWCVLKHLLLADYHLLELTTQIETTNEQANVFAMLSKSIKTIYSGVVKEEFSSKCEVCTKDLFLLKLFKGKRGVKK